MDSLRPFTGKHRLALAVLSVMLAHAVAAQERAPDAGSLLRETDPAQRALPSSGSLGEPQSAPGAKRAAEGVTVQVRSIRIIGAARYSEAELQSVVADLVGRDVDYLELRRAADRITQRYRNDGWFARAYLPEQTLEDGVLTIAVIEAQIGAIKIEAPEAGSLVSEDRIRRMLVAQQKQAALAIEELERAALLVDDLPGVSAAIVLAPGDAVGRTDIIARVVNTDRFVSDVEADNSGIESTGRERVTGRVQFASPFGIGDEATALVNASEGNQFARIGYELPVGPYGWRVAAAASMLEYELGGDFKALDAHGSATTWSLSASYPILRGNRTNARFLATAEERRYDNFALDLSTSNSEILALRTGLTFDHLDGFAGGGVTQWGVQATMGSLDLSRNAQDFAIDAATAHSNGTYSKLAWNAARLQRITSRDRLLISINGQTVSRNLDSSEQMSLGGAGGVRAYPELEASGDEGWIFSAEWTRTLPLSLSASVFYDMGEIAQHKEPWLNWNSDQPSLANHYTLDGAGMSIAWTGLAGIEISASAAVRFGDNPGADAVTGRDNDGSSHEPQIWVTARWRP